MYSKNLTCVLAIAFLWMRCAPGPSTPAGPSADSTFNLLSESFLSGYLAARPQVAVGLGFHQWDGILTDYSRASLDRELSRLKTYQDTLSRLDTASLSQRSAYDLMILENGIFNEIFTLEDLDSYRKNPMVYARAIDVNIYLQRNFAPLADRVGFIIKLESKAPDLFNAARANLNDSLGRPLIQMAIAVASGNVDFLQHDLPLGLKELHNDSLMKVFQQANQLAVSELNGYIAWLKKEKLPKAQDHYGIGSEKYQKMLQGEMISLSPQQVLALGLKQLAVEQAVFNQAAKTVNPKKKPIDVYRDLQKEHPTADGLIPEARQNLEAIRQFVVDRNIVTMPSEVRAVIKETPEYARSTSTASMDSPGPFEKKATEAFYYITPVDPQWTSVQKEDWLRQFDYFTMDNVTVHEVYPGHYTQFLHLNSSGATKIEKIFDSYAFSEGWAHYCEEMMVDQGFGSKGDSILAAKRRLAQTGDALLRLCRLCVSVKTHCEGMTVDQGTKFFMDNWYQGEKPSRQEALRGTFDPQYCFYTLGKLQILKLRDDFQRQEGAAFSLKRFHDLILDNGAPPVHLLRRLLLKDSSQWNQLF